MFAQMISYQLEQKSYFIQSTSYATFNYYIGKELMKNKQIKIAQQIM